MKNMAHQLIESHLAFPSNLKVGNEIYVRMDQTLTHDITAVMGYLAFEALDLPKVKTEVSVSYIDHNLLQIDNKTPDDHLYLQSVAEKFGLYLSRAGNGICHSIHYSRFGKPGKTLLGTDSHTTTAGALGMLSIGAGGMDVATAMAGLPIRLKMPSVVKVTLTGRLNPGVASKDVILEMLRRLTVKGGVNKIFEYVGPGVTTLSIPERATIANMGAELGATSSIFPADGEVFSFLKAQGREQDYMPIFPEEGCSYDEEMIIDLSALEPLVACPDMPDRVKKVKDMGPVKVHQVFIGSCTNGSYSDFKKAAAILKDKAVHKDVSLVLGITTKQTYLQLLEDGSLADLVSAGARVAELACGACTGIGIAPPTKGVSVRTSNRNFKGRGGTSDASLYLVSPEVAAATALKGYLAEPSEVMEDISVLGQIKEPHFYPIDDKMLIPPLEDGSNVEIIRGPNIQPLPVNSPPSDRIEAKVSLKAGDNISTDDITPASAEFSSMRSNIPAIAEFAYSRYDPGFVNRAKSFGTSFIVGGENYGQGSSREHAAITPMFLGVKAILAKSFARIHKNNLINHGVLPLVFENSGDYEGIDQEDLLSISDSPTQIKAKRVKVDNLTKGNTFVTLLELSDDEVEILLCGGQLPYIKKQCKI